MAGHPSAAAAAGASAAGPEPAPAIAAAALPSSGSGEVPVVEGPIVDLPLGRGEQLLNTIARLRADQQRMRQERQAISKALKLANKKKNRLKVRARQLTDDDLVEVLRMRQAMRGTSAAPSSSGASSSTDAPMPEAGGDDPEVEPSEEL